MQGGVRKRGKTWSYFFYAGIVNGKKKTKEKGGFRTKAEAQKALNDAISDFNNNGYIEPKKTTFIAFCNDWVSEFVQNNRKVSTYNRYKELIKKYFENSIGQLSVSDIQCYHIEQLLQNIKNTNTISNTTLQGIYTILNTIFNRALKLKLIKDNPCKFVERPKRDKFTPDILDIDEIKQILALLDLSDDYEHMFYLAMKLTLELGLRRGELGGVEWSDIDYKENSISIKNNLIYTNGHVRMSTPKTKESTRKIYISSDLLDLLKQLKARQEENKINYSEFYKENIFENKKYDLVMVWQNGNYIHPSYYPHKLTKLLKKANINKSVRFHDLRHTNATLLLQQGVDFKTIQTRLGHKDINTTLNIYSHVNLEMQKKATDKLLQVFEDK